MMLLLWLAIFVPLGFAGFFGLIWLMDKQCERCIRREPDNPYCCE